MEDMRPVELTMDEAEMIDIWADNVIVDFQEAKHKERWTEDDLSEIRVAVLIRAKMRHFFPEIGESLKELDRKIRKLLDGKDG